MKQTIFHIIDSLGTGGAEMLLKNTVSLLPEFHHVVLYLYMPDHVKTDFNGESVEFIYLGHKGWKDILQTARRIRKLIQGYRPLLVHAHLIKASLIARIATPADVPLVNSLHSALSLDAFEKNRLSLWMERMTLRERHALIAVSGHVLQDYLQYVPFKGRSFVLYNFLPDHFFNKALNGEPHEVLRCVAIGNLKEVKNYDYLLDVFRQFKNGAVTLDIYGVGDMDAVLQQRIDSEGLPVTLKGLGDTAGFLPQYDLFLQASIHEGFGLSVIEAMAAGLPVFISDIPVFREITGGHAHYFPLDNVERTASLLQELQANATWRSSHVEAAYEWCRERYNAAAYKKNLLHIYNEVSA